MTETSIAPPHVTSTANLVWEAMGVPLSEEDGNSSTAEPIDEVHDVIKTTADSVLGACEEGAGLDDADAVVDEAITRSN